MKFDCSSYYISDDLTVKLEDAKIEKQKWDLNAPSLPKRIGGAKIETQPYLLHQYVAQSPKVIHFPKSIRCTNNFQFKVNFQV